MHFEIGRRSVFALKTEDLTCDGFEAKSPCYSSEEFHSNLVRMRLPVPLPRFNFLAAVYVLLEGPELNV